MNKLLNLNTGTNFNFIMILFYSLSPLDLKDVFTRFQFHYDLILLFYYAFHMLCVVWFQFHYDLILLYNLKKKNRRHKKISISLWSYSIYEIDNITTQIDKQFQFHYDLILFMLQINNNTTSKQISISLWSYSIVKVLLHF